MSESKRRARYTLEYKLEAVRLVKGDHVARWWRIPPRQGN